VLTLPSEPIDDEREMDEAEKHDIELIEPGKDAAEAL